MVGIQDRRDICVLKIFESASSRPSLQPCESRKGLESFFRRGILHAKLKMAPVNGDSDSELYIPQGLPRKPVNRRNR